MKLYLKKNFISVFVFCLCFLFCQATTTFASPNVDYDHLNEAAEMADSVLEALGEDLPEIRIIPNSYDAYAAGETIFIGDQMIMSHDVMSLSQIILHEAGHIFQGHTGLVNHVMDLLISEGLMTPEQRNEIMRNDELIADTYAAIGSWMLEPGVVMSTFSQYMADRNEPGSDTHPSSEQRIEFVENVIDLLNIAEVNGVFEQAGFESLHQSRELGLVNSTSSFVEVSPRDFHHNGEGIGGDGTGYGGNDSGTVDPGGDAGGGGDGGGG